MLAAKMDLFGSAVWQGLNENQIRVPSHAEAQERVLTALLATPIETGLP